MYQRLHSYRRLSTSSSTKFWIYLSIIHYNSFIELEIILERCFKEIVSNNIEDSDKIFNLEGKSFIIYTPVRGADLPEYPIYHQFPAVPQKGNLREVEMRGKDFSDGFAILKKGKKVFYRLEK